MIQCLMTQNRYEKLRNNFYTVNIESVTVVVQFLTKYLYLRLHSSKLDKYTLN